MKAALSLLAPDDEFGIDLVHYRDFVSNVPFALELGGSLPSLTLRYETYGTLNADRSNAILVCHALSGDHHVAGRYSPEDREPGWWDDFVGPGRTLDTDRYYVIGVNSIGSCKGSTGPLSINPETGRAYGPDFPQLTLRDFVHAQHLLVRALGVRRLYAVIGGSMGGMQALLWATDFPGEAQNAVALACGTRLPIQLVAINEIARNAIMSDPQWQGGHYTPGAEPKTGLALARMVGHITYCSATSMERKFGRRRQTKAISGSKARAITSVAADRGPYDIEFEVESYLNFQSKKFAEHFDANAYLGLIKAVDRFDLTASNPLEKVFAPVRARVRLIGFTSDWLCPPAENRVMLAALRRLGKDATYTEIETDAGHDAFLIPNPELFSAIRAALE
jgi:homoserine O-acetyltransferase